MNYKIVIKNNCFTEQVLAIMPKLIILDSNVDLKYDKQTALINLDKLEKIPVYSIETSEHQKDFDLYFKLLNIFEQNSINRNDTIMIVGGGVLIDVASFAASTYKRGINYVNVPTTTLAMIDSSVGSKNGLNYLGQKNLIGNITDPSMVIIDPNFLKTLDTRNFNNGLAEAIKIGYLSNEQILDLLNQESLDIEQVIKLSVFEKIKYVDADKFDHGQRNYLNFGHTFGHAIEAVTNFHEFLHGEAVSIGMVIASGYDSRLIELLQKYNLPTQLPTNLKFEELIAVMAGDKKNTSDKIRVILKNPKLKIVDLEKDQIKKLFKTSYVVSNQPIANRVSVNKSKSHIHRLLAATLATKSAINFDFNAKIDLSDDVIQSIKIIEAVGGLITYQHQKIFVDCQHVNKPENVIKIYKSATTYRVFTPLLCSMFGPCDIELDEQLASRPHDVFASAIDGTTHNLSFSQNNYAIDGSISSQFISGYIFALIAQNKEASITITGSLTSAPYIDMTIKVANQFGCDVRRDDKQITICSPANTLSNKTYDVEPDMSSLSYFIVYNKLCELTGKQRQVQLPNTFENSMQADSIVTDVLTAKEIDMTDCPDLLPILVGYGLLNKRGLTLTNINRIKYKECDRALAMMENFADLEAIEKTDNSLVIKPVSLIPARKITTFGDHRIAMAATIIGKFSDGDFVIDDYTVVHKSFPTFFEQCQGGLNEGIK